MRKFDVRHGRDSRWWLHKTRVAALQDFQHRLSRAKLGLQLFGENRDALLVGDGFDEHERHRAGAKR